VVGLPWAFKLVAGPFMDRFTYPSLGRRRPWVMAAQTGLLASLLLLTTIDDATSQLTLLTAIGFLVNCFGATQDVAVDGMAIDVVPVLERGRVNAFMAFGQVLGYSVFGALSGLLLARFGLTVTALVCASTVGAILVWVAMTKEREGDRYLPSISQRANDQPNLAKPVNPTTLPLVFKSLLRVLTLPMSLILFASILLERIGGGMITVAAPLFAVKELGYLAEDFSQTYGLIGGIAAVLGLLIGVLVDRHGAKAILLSGMLANSGVLWVLSINPDWWFEPTFVLAGFALAIFFGHVAFVGMIALCMNICWWKVAATQFSVYMAFSNLGRSMGAGLYAGISEQVSYAQVMQIAAIGLILSALVLMTFHQDRQQRAIAGLDTAPPPEA
jgi:PAT family beta-lactamase induction signal transducer AmpG